MNSILTPVNLRSIHIFTEKLSFPVCTFALTAWDEVQISYLNHNIKSGRYTAFDICRWCQMHGIHYQILFPDNVWIYIFRDPKRFLCYLYLKLKL